MNQVLCAGILYRDLYRFLSICVNIDRTILNLIRFHVLSLENFKQIFLEIYSYCWIVSFEFLYILLVNASCNCKVLSQSMILLFDIASFGGNHAFLVDSALLLPNNVALKNSLELKLIDLSGLANNFLNLPEHLNDARFDL